MNIWCFCPLNKQFYIGKNKLLLERVDIKVSDLDTNTSWTKTFSKTLSAVNNGATGNDKLSIKFNGTYMDDRRLGEEYRF